MNIINSLSTVDNVSCCVYSTHQVGGNWFAANGVAIKKIAKQYKSLLRYWCYVKFNIACFVHLLFTQPQTVVAFETYSILPVYWYKKLFKQAKIFIHFHEYESLGEIESSTAYSKFLNINLKKLFVKAAYISQTNPERRQFFLNDYPFIDVTKAIIAPNFPPKNWYQYSSVNKAKNKTSAIKLVHIGALSIETMFTKEIVEWVMAQNGNYTIDFYTDNISKSAKNYFDSINNVNVKLCGGINYYELPNVLKNYDVGLTIYNGHIPNYIYNVPNKVLEYLACGLNVWYSKSLISTQKFAELYQLNGCYKIDFGTMDIPNMTNVNEFNSNASYYNLLVQENTLIEHIKKSVLKQTTK